MPAAAVIPAPRVYTKAVAVKTLVVEFQHLESSFIFEFWMWGMDEGPAGMWVLCYISARRKV